MLVLIFAWLWIGFTSGPEKEKPSVTDNISCVSQKVLQCGIMLHSVQDYYE